MTIEDILNHYFIMRGATSIPDKYWKEKDTLFPDDALRAEIESYTNQQISKVISEIEEKCEKYDWRAADGPYVHGYDDAIDQVHKVLEEYKK